jgi:hypothetical protein
MRIKIIKEEVYPAYVFVYRSEVDAIEVEISEYDFRHMLKLFNDFKKMQEKLKKLYEEA